MTVLIGVAYKMLSRVPRTEPRCVAGTDSYNGINDVFKSKYYLNFGSVFGCNLSCNNLEHVSAISKYADSLFCACTAAAATAISHFAYR